jgi:hypothetical protein
MTRRKPDIPHRDREFSRQDVTQTHGEPISEPPGAVLLDGQAPPGLWDGLAAQIRRHGFDLTGAPGRGIVGWGERGDRLHDPHRDCANRYARRRAGQDTRP